MKIYALWSPIMSNLIEENEVSKNEYIHFFAPPHKDNPLPFIGRVLKPMDFSALGVTQCECGQMSSFVVSGKKMVKKDDYIVVWNPDFGKSEFERFVKMAIILGEKPEPQKVLQILNAKMKFNNFTVSGGCKCRKMSEMEILTGGKKCENHCD